MPYPVTLHFAIRWSRYYKTAVPETACQHSITAVHQQQAGTMYLVWLHSSLAHDSNIGPDCEIRIQNLHHFLDGFRAVERMDPQEGSIAFKVNQTQFFQSQQNLLWQLEDSATVEVACKAERSISFHQPTVDMFTSRGEGGHEILFLQLQQIPSQAAQSQQPTQHQMHEQNAFSSTDTQPNAAQPSHQQVSILPSRVGRTMLMPQQGSMP